MATCEPRCSASASLTGASQAGRDQRPHAARAHRRSRRRRWRRRWAGDRARWCRCRRRAAPTAASSQFARCAAKISAGLPSSRSRIAIASVSSESRMRPRPCCAVVVPQPVDMRELGADAAEIVPDAAQDRLDLGGRLLRERGGEVGAADAVLRQPRPDAPHQAAGEVRHGAGIDQPDRAQRMHGEEAEHRIAERAAARCVPSSAPSHAARPRT